MARYNLGKTEYCVLIGKVISPKKIKNMKKFRKELLNACFEVNEIYSKDLYAELGIVKDSGEIRCVLYYINNLYEIISLINELSSDYMRFVLVYDHIDKGLHSRKMSQMDGSAFNNASNLMKSLEKNNLMFKMDLGNAITEPTTNYIKTIEKLIINNINLIYLLKSGWTSKKAKIIREYEKTKDQKKVAQNLKESQQTVSHHIISSNWKELNKIETDLKKSIKIISTGITTC
jgi:hypothetical protein